MVTEEGKVELTGPRPQVTDVKVIANSDGTGDDSSIVANSKTPGDELYISFKASIEGGTIKEVSCDNGEPSKIGDLWVTKITNNGTYKFTIVGTVDGDDWDIVYPKKVDKYNKRIGIEAGDYINYVPDTATPYAKDKLVASITGYTATDCNQDDLPQENLEWQVLRIYEDGSMDLIGSPTSYDVGFYEVLGFNNGVYVMNDICKQLYSKNSKGITARSVNAEDAYKWLTADGIDRKNFYVRQGAKTYQQDKAYMPHVLIDAPGNSDSVYTSPTTETFVREFGSDGTTYTLTLTGTTRVPEMTERYFGSALSMFSTLKQYWFATRVVQPSTYEALCLLEMSNGMVGGAPGKMTETRGYNPSGIDGWINHASLRPVVTLSPDVDVTVCTGENSTTNMHTIEW